jgi:hypothetical protein
MPYDTRNQAIVSLVVIAVGRFGDQVRDALDPRAASRI